MNTRKVLAGFVLASSGFFAAAGASAVPVSSWDWVSDGGFVDTSGAPDSATCSNGSQGACSLGFDSGVTPSGVTDTSSVMTWGTPSDSDASNGEQSGLQGVFGSSGDGPYDAELLGSGSVMVGSGVGPASGPFQELATNGGWFNTGAAVHYNNIITEAGGHMDTATLITNFNLTALGGPPDETTIDIGFNETFNTDNVSGCANDTPHDTACDDIFSLSATLDPIVFSVGDGHVYQASFRFADGPGAAVQGGDTVFTAEDSPGTAVMYVQGRIDTIPLPGVLALMGMGLVMLGWRVRGRKLA